MLTPLDLSTIVSLAPIDLSQGIYLYKPKNRAEVGDTEVLPWDAPVGNL
jgi:hypothetical protein